jgi:peptide/nickel transport system substrate-binding protein
MMHLRRVRALLPCILLAMTAAAAYAQKYGGTLRFPLRENPSSASLHEESSITAIQPFMAVFNNLVIYDQQIEMATADSIRPELATAWSWSADNKVLSMKLRAGVKWHDGKPFTSADVQCTWETVIGKRDAGWRKNSHKEWYTNLKEIQTNGPYEVRFVLGRPQPSFLSFLASGWSPVYPCHVDGRTMRQKPVGTGPFKVAEFRPNESIRLVKNPEYWKPGRPYLDGINFRIVPNTATRMLAFQSGEFDMSGTSTVLNPLQVKEVQAKLPNAVCSTTGTMVTGVVLINHKAPPFDNPKIRRAIALALDRNAFLASLHGGGRLGGVMMTAPYGAWGLTPAQLESVPGFGKDVEKNRAEARKLMEEAGYGPKNPLKVPIFVRASSPAFVAGATLTSDQLRHIYIESTVEVKEYSIFTGAIIKGAYQLGFETSGSAIDDPDVVLYENFMCASIRNYNKYCSKEVEAKIDEQSQTLDPAKRRQLVNALDLLLQQETARVAVYHSTSSACWHPYVKGYLRSKNGIYTHHRMEDVWMDK